MKKDVFDDGMQHTYSTCPQCRTIVSTENIVWVDNRRMCRGCLRSKQVAAKADASPEGTD